MPGDSAALTDPGGAPPQSLRFLLLYALAMAGASVAYVPFLTILLPMRVAVLAQDGVGPVGGGQDVAWLSWIAMAGAVVASLANIAFGQLSDRIGNRRGMIAAGLVLSTALLAGSVHATSLGGIIAMVMVWQMALNLMISPLTAWAGDCVPHGQSGLLGGLLAFAPGLGALSGALATLPALADAGVQLVFVGAVVMAMVLPVLLIGAPLPQPDLVRPAPRVLPGGSGERLRRRSVVVRMWLARLAVQVAEAALFAFVYVWFRTIDPVMDGPRTAAVFSAVLLLSAPLALVIGRWSDRRGSAIAPLAWCAVFAAAGLLVMSFADRLALALVGYAGFGLSTSVFLALHAAQTLRVLPRPERRGRDLGLFNLTNTVPSVIMSGFTLALVPVIGFGGLFMLFAALALVAAGLLASIPALSR